MTSVELKLIERARAFNQAALGKIYDLYSDALYAYAYKHVGSVQVAEDLVAETFKRFLNALKSGGGPTNHLKAYLYRIAHNLITDTYRRKPPPPLELDEDRLGDTDQEPSRIVADQQDADQIRMALRYLTPDQRQVIVLRFLEGWTTSEVAQVMEKSIGSVKAQQHRGLAALQRILLENQDQRDSSL